VIRVIAEVRLLLRESWWASPAGVVLSVPILIKPESTLESDLSSTGSKQIWPTIQDKNYFKH
jgi:hypothetical protein